MVGGITRVPKRHKKKKLSVQTENDYIALKKGDPELCCVRAEPRVQNASLDKMDPGRQTLSNPTSRRRRLETSGSQRQNLEWGRREELVFTV